MQTVAWIASVLVLMSFYMRNPLHMRFVAVLGNLAFIAYALLGLQDGIFEKVLPILVLHVMALMVNTARLREAITTGRESLPSMKGKVISLDGKRFAVR
ncbi:MAG: hypothetical protein KA271_00900 [Propionivibrio sp.]|nr:hypothetical protein [Propionivibrio sp.]